MASAPTTGRRTAARIAAGLAVAAALGGAWWALRPAPPPPAPPPPPPPPVAAPAPAPAPAPRLQLVSVTGPVEAAGPDGAWRPAVAGEALPADGLLRTGPGAAAALSAGAASRLDVGERTQLAVSELTAAVHRFRLAHGVVKVDYEPDGDRVVRIEEAGGAAVAEARGARFHVTAGGLAFAVASQVGTVSLTAAGRTVAVASGESSLAAAGEPPTPPRPVPTDLLLKVAEASRVGPAGHCLDTVGRVDPGSLVTVDAAPVEVGADGRFVLHVARRAGLAAVEVRAVAPDGRITVRQVPCLPLPEARIEGLRVRWKHDGP